jgi:hypothetical protein
MLLYDQASNFYLPNLAVFKTLMLILLFGLTYFLYKKIRKIDDSKWTSIAILFTILYSILDLTVLIGIFKMDISMWLMAILPFCIFSFFGIGYWILRPKMMDKK